jgi:hypothetical protein
MGAAAAIGALLVGCGGDGAKFGPGQMVVPPPELVLPGPTTNGGTPPTPETQKTPGPWPTRGVTDYTQTYGLPYGVQSVGVDDAYNIWLLRGSEIGVLRPGTTSAVWASNIGQAAGGFWSGGLATNSTVICGGAANQAYVGYSTYDLPNARLETVDDPEFRKGDMDVVQLNPDGTISLTEHLWRSTGTSQPWPHLNIGIRNSNDWHYDEDRTVFTCQKVMRGRDRGEIYIGTNHGVTRIRGLEYDSHRHPVWARMTPNGPSLMLGYTFGLGIAQNGDVLIANEWKVAILPPPPELGDWDSSVKAPWALDTYNGQLNSLEDFDFWRGFQQTIDQNYYLGSNRYGLWQLIRKQSWANWVKIAGLPTERINALAATDDGSLYIGTDDAGLWRMDAQKSFSRVSDVKGSKVQQLVYDPTVEPSMLYVLTPDAVTVIRGP